MASKNDVSAVDEYLAEKPPEVREALENLRQIILSFVPDVKQRISYRIPIFALERDLVGFAAHKNHLSFYTMSPVLVKKMEKELENYEISGTTIHFQPDNPLPASLVEKILQARVEESSRK